MYNCLTSGPGHYLVHHPQIRTFTCTRCHTQFINFNPPVPRKGSLQPPLSALGGYGLQRNNRTKAPWRCVITNCKVTMCEPCAEFIYQGMEQIRRAKEEANESDHEFDIATELRKLELVLKKRPNDLSKNEEREDFMRMRKGLVTTTATAAGYGMEFFQADMPIEVDDDDSSDDDDGFNMDFASRPFTRSVAVAAAAATAGIRRASNFRPLQKNSRTSLR